ncbi:hypothetical protein [Streptomyces longisporus]|uniref:hypothetical protein n=1 Tax=Streptomyces longisporus TaxID=1948 RepID=UPI0031DA7B6A
MAQRRSWIVNCSILAVAALWILTDCVISMGIAFGHWTVWIAIALALAAVWVGTGRWRYHPRPEGRSADEVAAVAQRQSRMVKRSTLTLVALWILTNVVSIWAS